MFLPIVIILQITFETVKRDPREGWATDSARVAANDEVLLLWPELANDDDTWLQW